MNIIQKSLYPTLLVVLSIVFSSVIFSQTTVVIDNTTGGPSQDWIVPPCVNSIDVQVGGAQGGGPCGGNGALLTGTIPLQPGDVLTIQVGEQPTGQAGGASAYGTGGNGFASTNGNSAYDSYGGGGATAIYINGVLYMVVGGGGGSGGGSVQSGCTNAGGIAGCPNGTAGGNTYGQGGQPGTLTGPGAGGTPWAGTPPGGSPGVGTNGGNGGLWQTASGGGGGGGYYGGGGGGNDGCCTGANGGGGGGAGSSLIPAGFNCTAGGNSGSGEVVINYSGGISAVASNTGPYCTGETIDLSSGGGVEYVWSGPNGFTSTAQNPSIPNATMADAGVYQVIVSDTANCANDSDTITTTVVVNQTPTVDPIADQTICNGSSTTTVNFNGNSGASATYDWTNDNTGIGLSGSGSGDIISFTGTATTQDEIGNITVTPSTAFCTGTPESFTITVLLDPSVSVSNDTTVCENGTATLVATATGGGGGPYDYHWDFTADLADTQYVSPTTAGSYSVYAESPNGCISSTLTINVDLYPPLSGTISPFDTICPGYFTDIWATASGGIGQPYTFTWNTGNTQTGPNNYTETVSPANTYTYIVTVTDGCETSPYVMETEVYVAPLPVPSYEVLDPIQCEPAVFHIVNTTDPAMSQYVYWLVDGHQEFFNQDTIATDSLWNGVYDLQMIVTSYLGCVDSTTFVGALSVNAHTDANFQFSPNPITMFNTNVAFNNFSYNADTYQWYFEHGSPSSSTDENPLVSFPDGVTGTYEVMLVAMSDMGCIDTLIRPITVYPEVLLYAPNTFTPDDDAHNDDWRVYMEGIDIMDFELLIFNRWGEVVWESHDIEVGWDGTYSGKRLPNGTYTWTIEVKNLLNDERMKYNGHVNILR